jgi:hypothetical protein
VAHQCRGQRADMLHQHGPAGRVKEPAVGQAVEVCVKDAVIRSAGGKGERRGSESAIFGSHGRAKTAGL